MKNRSGAYLALAAIAVGSLVALCLAPSGPPGAEVEGANPARRAAGELHAALGVGGAQDWPVLVDAVASTPDAAAASDLLEVHRRISDPMARAGVLRALHRIGGEVGADSLARIACAADAHDADQARLWLSRLEDRSAAEALVSILDRERWRGPLARAAARALGRTRLRQYVPILARAAGGGGVEDAIDDAAMRSAAVDALGRIGDPVALPVLETCLADTERKVRADAIRALGAIPCPQSIGALERFLAGRPRDGEADLAREILGSLRGEPVSALR